MLFLDTDSICFLYWTQARCMFPGAEDCRLEDIPQIQNGSLEGTPNISHGSVIRFRCNEGYTSDGQQSMRCLYGKWQGRRPSCLKQKGANLYNLGVFSLIHNKLSTRDTWNIYNYQYLFLLFTRTSSWWGIALVTCFTIWRIFSRMQGMHCMIFYYSRVTGT